MGSLYEHVGRLLEETGLRFNKVQGETHYSFGFETNYAAFPCYVVINEERQQFVFYVTCPFRVTEEKEEQAIEFITRANYGLNLGNFEMDLRDGEFLYKTSIELEGGFLRSEVMKRLVFSSIFTLEHYFPALVALMTTEVGAKEAISLVENQEMLLSESPLDPQTHSREELPSFTTSATFRESMESLPAFQSLSDLPAFHEPAKESAVERQPHDSKTSSGTKAPSSTKTTEPTPPTTKTSFWKASYANELGALLLLLLLTGCIYLFTKG